MCRVSRVCASRGGALSLAGMCAALCLALVGAAAHDKRAEMSPVPFVMGSRYGRSPERVMAPRNDRFFMGSRYGKRSEFLQPLQALAGLTGAGTSLPGGVAELPGVTSRLPGVTSGLPGAGVRAGCVSGERGGCAPLLCDYTGLMTLYNCVVITPHQHNVLFDKRGEDDAGPDASEED